MRSLISRLILALFVVSLLGAPAWAQQVTIAQQSGGTSTTPTAARGDVATRCDSASGAGQQTLTLQNPGPGLSNYITVVGVFGLGSGPVTAATPTLPTTTGINGTAASLGVPISLATTAAFIQGSVGGGFTPLATPVKSNANTAGTFVGPAAITGMSQGWSVCYYAAP